MINITSISLKNFLSIGNATQALRLDEHGLTLVLGNNSDANGGVTKNGAGKTAILQALSFGLYGQPLTKIKVDNLINNINGKAMYVVVDFEKDGEKYRVERGRRPNILRFYRNGEELSEEDKTNNAKGENAETQIDISALIGMSHTMFKHIVALNTYTEPFLKLGATPQREVIEELLGVTQISARAEHLKELIGYTKDAIKTEDAAIKAMTASNQRILQTIDGTEADMERWNRKHERLVNDLNEQLEAMEAIDFDTEIARFEELERWRKSERVLRSDRNYLERDITAIDRDQKRLTQDRKRALAEAEGTGATAAIDRLGRDLVRLNASHAANVSGLAHSREMVTKFADMLASPGELECKTCGQELQGTDHLTSVVARIQGDYDSYVAQVARIEGEQRDLEADIADVERDINARTIEAEDAKVTARELILVIDQELITLDEQLLDKSTMMAKLVNDLDALGEQPQTLFESRDEVYTAKHARETLSNDLVREQASENPYVGQLESLRQTMQPIDMTVLNDAHDLLRHQDFLMKLLTSKDSFIRRKIIEQNLSYLNNRLNYYLNKLGLPHEVLFQSDLSVDITLLGRDFDFAQLSRGESNRVIMATSWAFRDVWESLNHRINVMWMDELLDNGTDGNGAEAGLSILKAFGRAGRNIFLVSHRDELIGRIDRTLYVSKENGFTSISEEA